MARRISIAIAGAAVALGLAVPAHAQGKSNGKGNPHQSSPPSSSPLPNPAVAAGPVSPASPLSWLDDASLLPPGDMALTVSTMHWSGLDLSEVAFPIVDASVGVTPRVQIGASVPHVVGSADGTGAVGGVGTSYFSAKIAVLNDATGVKLAVTPMVEVLGYGAVQALAPGDGRTQFGLPVSVEAGHGQVRVFASTGFFTRGVWFAGGGTGLQLTPKVGATISFTHSRAGDAPVGVSHSRRELAGAVSCFVTPQLGVYGGLSQTIATSDADGAGTAISGGVSFLFKTHVSK